MRARSSKIQLRSRERLGDGLKPDGVRPTQNKWEEMFFASVPMRGWEWPSR